MQMQFHPLLLAFIGFLFLFHLHDMLWLNGDFLIVFVVCNLTLDKHRLPFFQLH